MVQNLRRESMRKPIVVDNSWHTIVGDTRLMACRILKIDHAPVLAQLSQAQHHVIDNISDLQKSLGFDQSSVIQWQPRDADLFRENITWFDIGDKTTTHHWLDEQEALRVIKRYLSQRDQNFRFDHAWFETGIDWLSF
jgi:hypothetical protein